MADRVASLQAMVVGTWGALICAVGRGTGTEREERAGRMEGPSRHAWQLNMQVTSIGGTIHWESMPYVSEVVCMLDSKRFLSGRWKI